MRRHPVDLLALLFGGLSAVFAVLAMTSGVAWLDDASRWTAPIVLLAVGAVGLCASFDRSRTR